MESVRYGRERNLGDCEEIRETRDDIKGLLGSAVTRKQHRAALLRRKVRGITPDLLYRADSDARQRRAHLMAGQLERKQWESNE